MNLKPCPWPQCGSRNIRLCYETTYGNVTKAWVKCVACGACGPVCRGEDAKEQAVETWDNRPGYTAAGITGCTGECDGVALKDCPHNCPHTFLETVEASSSTREMKEAGE